MPRYEYKVVPAPTRGQKGKGVRGAEARFSHAIQELLNGLAGYGWEFQRAETLPSIERAGLTGTTTEWRNVLIFRRPREGDAAEFSPELLPAPAPIEDDTPPVEAPVLDNGVENTGAQRGLSSTLNVLARVRSLAPTGPEAPPELAEAPLPDTEAGEPAEADQQAEPEETSDAGTPASDPPPQSDDDALTDAPAEEAEEASQDEETPDSPKT